MVKVMGYFDDAIIRSERGGPDIVDEPTEEESLEHGEFSGSDIVELSEEEYLEHGRFGSFRKNHKYIGRIWKGGRWVYRYAKKKAGYIYGSEYRKDMDKYHDAEDRAQANMWKANEDNWKLKNKIEDNAKNPSIDGVTRIINGKVLRQEKARNQEYFDKQYTKAQDANDKYGRAGTKYYNSLAYKVEKATGSYDKSRAERARKKGYDGLAERHEEAYNNAPVVKAKKAVKSAASKVKDALKPKETATVKDTFTGETRNVDPNSSVYKQLEKESKKKKKGLFHDSEDGEIMTYFPARDDNSLEHSSGPWKNHKYIIKEGSGKDAKYYYGRAYGNGYQFKYSNRRGAEKQAADEDFWYDSDNDYALTERGKKALDFYNDQDRSVRNAVKESIATDANKRFGANGMPSDVASKSSKLANNNLNNAVIEANLRKTLKEINRQAELKERYQKKGMNGMPSSVINAMTTKVKDIS